MLRKDWDAGVVVKMEKEELLPVGGSGAIMTPLGSFGQDWELNLRIAVRARRLPLRFPTALNGVNSGILQDSVLSGLSFPLTWHASIIVLLGEWDGNSNVFFLLLASWTTIYGVFRR